ncbi:hypothetical protein NQ318_005833 [Aromia moschata]|uniref:Uncharacterized protein n=1 Tax=Aromia moschata TaxID=1265417 RepID=A0AAV8YS23_9CUCU|nr:hypothetical protein NQ318_005833 [Aromia moschata]
MTRLLFCWFFLFLGVQYAELHSYHLGACPTIEPQQDFNMRRLQKEIFRDVPTIALVIMKNKSAERKNQPVRHMVRDRKDEHSQQLYSVQHNRIRGAGEYQIEEISQHFILALTPLKHGYHYKGTLKGARQFGAGQDDGVAGSSSFTVFMTDYDTYAGIFTCQKLTFANRQSATILSRTKTLDRLYIDKLRMKLSSAQVDPYDLSIISQKDCPKNLTAGYNININDDTISAHAAADVIRKAGDKLGDGVEYLSGKAKDVYHKVSDRDSNEDVKPARNVVAPDSEWLP